MAITLDEVLQMVINILIRAEAAERKVKEQEEVIKQLLPKPDK